MVIGIFGESCTGKSTLADKLKESINWKRMKLLQSGPSRQSCVKLSAAKISSMSFRKRNTCRCCPMEVSVFW